MNRLRFSLVRLLLTGFIALCGFGSLARADHLIYDDSLNNNWQDWGWAPHNSSSTAQVHSGASSIAITPGPWEALFLHHSALDTTPFGELTFWVHGGPNGGQQLKVVALINDVDQPGVSFNVAANTWTKVVIPLASLSADARPNLTGLWFQANVGVAQETFYIDDISLTSSVPVIPPEPVDGLGVYEDALINGWNNWSWANVNTGSTANVHTGSSAIEVLSGAWTALSLQHNALNTSSYASVSFWINGGPQGGQILKVIPTFNNVSAGGKLLPALAANTWTKITIPLSELDAANRTDFTGLWWQNFGGVDAPVYYIDDIALNNNPPPALINVSVNTKSTVRKVDARTFGLNAAIWDSVFNTVNTANLLNEVDNQVLRFPGGSISDLYHWETGRSHGETWSWATSFDDFAKIAKATDAQVFITANYGTGTPEEAAAWVRYSNITKGYGFKYWEVGNENYGSWEADINARAHDPVIYATRFKQYYQQMKAVDPTIKVGAVVLVGEDESANHADQSVVNPRTGQTHRGWTPLVLSTLKTLGVTPDFVIHHRYEQAPGGESDDFLLSSSAAGWKNDAANLRQMLKDYLGANGAKVELTCTENNSVYGDPGKQSTSLVNGLFWADSVGNILQTEFNSLIWWDLRNGQDSTKNNSKSLYGWRNYGDYGIVNNATPAGPADRYPTFYVYKLLQHFARGGETVVPVTSDYSGLSTYAVTRGARVHLLVINKKRFNALTTKFTVAGRVLGKNATLYRYGIPEDEAARTGTGSADVQKSQQSNLGSTFTLTVPPYSATVIILTTKPAGGAEPGFPE